MTMSHHDATGSEDNRHFGQDGCPQCTLSLSAARSRPIRRAQLASRASVGPFKSRLGVEAVFSVTVTSMRPLGESVIKGVITLLVRRQEIVMNWWRLAAGFSLKRPYAG